MLSYSSILLQIPKRSPTGVVALQERAEVDEPGFYLSRGNRTTLVSALFNIHQRSQYKPICADFMSIRKIPLKEQSYLDGDEWCMTTESEEDPSATTLQNKMREFLLTDRALHDQVMFDLIWLHSN
jgi:hypothetical protein